MPETSTQMYNSTHHVSSDPNSNDSDTPSHSVMDVSSSQGYLKDNSISLQELGKNCENHTSSSSLRSISVQGYVSPYEERRSYTHQVVVVAPITGRSFEIPLGVQISYILKLCCKLKLRDLLYFSLRSKRFRCLTARKLGGERKNNTGAGLERRGKFSGYWDKNAGDTGYLKELFEILVGILAARELEQEPLLAAQA